MNKIFRHEQDTRSDLDIASWLIKKGADITLPTSDRRLCKLWTVPIGLSHRIGIDLGFTSTSQTTTWSDNRSDSWIILKCMISRIQRMSETLSADTVARLRMLSTLFSDLLRCSILDTCNCACSEAECSPLSALLIGYKQNFDVTELDDGHCEAQTPFFLACVLGEFIYLIRALLGLSQHVNQSKRWCTSLIRF